MALITKDLPKYGPVVPVIVIDKIEDALPLAGALLEGGIRVLEITLRTAVALKAIELIAKEFPEAVVGAGTIRTTQDLKNAKDAGSQFCVSPGYTNQIGEASKVHGLPLLPGVSTCSELMQANSDGFDFLKLFPAEVVGGIALLKSWLSPFPDIIFCPTGGITRDSAGNYLALKNVVCVGGSWLTNSEILKQKDWKSIKELAVEASKIRS